MPGMPTRFDYHTLSKYFDMMDTMDPKGARLGQEVGEFADNTINGILTGQGLGDGFGEGLGSGGLGF